MQSNVTSITALAGKPRLIKGINPEERQAYEWRELLKEKLQKKLFAGVKMKDMAAATGLGVQTISNIISGTTTFPRFDTIARLMIYIGYEIKFVKTK